MKLFEKILKKEFIFFIFLFLPFFYLAVQYLFSGNLEVYDGPGHLQLIWNLREHLWPAFWGWNNFSLLGFDQGIYYPPLFHYCATILSFLFGIENSVKILIASFTIILPVSSYFLSSRIFSDFRAKVFLSSLLLIFVLIVPGYWGAGLKGLLEIGLLTSYVSTPLIFFYLGFLLSAKKPFSLGQTLLLSAIILTHFVAGLFSLAILATSLLVKIIKRKFSPSDLTHPLATLLITCFFWLPLLLRFGETSVSIHLPSLFWPNLAGLVIGLIISLSFWKFKKDSLLILSLSSVVLCLISLVDVLSFKFFPNQNWSDKIYSLHLYRYQIYSFLLLLITVSYWPLNFLFSRKKPKVNPLFVSALALLVMGFLVLRLNFIKKVNIEVQTGKISQGRFLEAFSREDSYPFVYSAQTKLIFEKNQSWAYGLFTDAGKNSPFISSLINTFSGAEEPRSEKSLSVEDKRVSLKKLGSLLDLFAIGNLVYLNRNDSGDQREKFFTLGTPDKALVSVPEQKLEFVSENWENEVKSWWLKDERLTSLLIKGEKPKNLTRNIPKEDPEIIKHNSGWSDFIIDTKSSVQTPILVKFSHSPNWKAFDESGRKLSIYKVSPNLMLVFAKGRIYFKYETLWYQKLSLLLSLFTPGVLFLITKRNVFQN